MSPPAVRNEIARDAAGIDCTARASPRSSDMITPPKPRPDPDRTSFITVGENTASWVRSISV